MKSFLQNTILTLLALTALTGCDVHQFPKQEEAPLPLPEVIEQCVPFRIVYDTDFYVWEHKYDPVLGQVEEANPELNIFPGYPGTSSRYTCIMPMGLQQVYVKAFSTSAPTRCVAEKSFTLDINGNTYDTDFDMMLPEGDTYNIIVWTQLGEYTEMPPFYDPTYFSRVQIIAANYRGNTDYRDGFRGKLAIDVTTPVTERQVVQMHRPMGKFELVTTDLSEFLDRETQARGLSTRASADDYRVVISFPMYYPNSYNAMEDNLENATTGVAFETGMTVTGTSEASLGFEYVLLNNISDSGVQARVDVYRPDGTRVAGSSTFTIPMRRNHHTMLRGAFLSMDGNGGVGIDPGFNGDHNVTWQ